ncbi:hypothetical protein Tco_1243054 [Tanacetum coccineum]
MRSLQKVVDSEIGGDGLMGSHGQKYSQPPALEEGTHGSLGRTVILSPNSNVSGGLVGIKACSLRLVSTGHPLFHHLVSSGSSSGSTPVTYTGDSQQWVNNRMVNAHPHLRNGGDLWISGLKGSAWLRVGVDRSVVQTKTFDLVLYNLGSDANSLEGSARIWLEKEPPRSIQTWDDLVAAGEAVKRILILCMRTRSQARVYGHKQHRQQQQVLPNLVEPPKDTMADNRTMAELLQAPTEGYEDAIVVLEIAARKILEIKHGLLTLVPNKQSKVHNPEAKPLSLKWSNERFHLGVSPDVDWNWKSYVVEVETEGDKGTRCLLTGKYQRRPTSDIQVDEPVVMH